MFHTLLNGIVLNTIIENLFSLILILYFSKILISFLISDLLWPTNFFNKRHVNTSVKKHYRVYVEVLQKSFFLQKRKYIFFKKIYKAFIADIRVK